MEEKVCSSCGLSKPLSDFYKEPRVKDGRFRRCKACHCKTTKEYREKNPEIYRKASLKHWRSLDDKKKQARWIKRYGLSAEQYYKMLAEQKEVCKICGQKCSTKQTLCVDHCHKTGKIRGLLCVKCNTSLGMLNDDVSLFYKAVEYLKNFEESP